MRRVLVIDDEAHRHEVLVGYVQRTFGMPIESAFTEAQAIAILRREPAFDAIFFDNDLGDGGGEGKNVAKTLLHELPEKLPKHVIVHSMNSAGPAEGIVSLFETYNRLHGTSVQVVRLPYNLILASG
jgi:CheY-like chemotaxis protein